MTGYVVVHHPNSQKPTLHIDPPFEECNTDQAKRRRKVDELEAHDLWDIGTVHLCQHCRPLDEPEPVE